MGSILTWWRVGERERTVEQTADAGQVVAPTVLDTMIPKSNLKWSPQPECKPRADRHAVDIGFQAKFGLFEPKIGETAVNAVFSGRWTSYCARLVLAVFRYI